ncbi:hypothetical protein [Hymenobacter fodinae]|uniref:Phage abortive infection protein n=1 Tax=Hymenobacter fodinae TaxID=2510796 RepID=A0A4Z0P941_9BACT|nr:hypothetical protein [Hymenobacter fodinae]TGE08438.1 hypothetical protein EU556_12055 [Hymenobacter fodinae]
MEEKLIDLLSAIGSILSALVAIAALIYSYYQSKTSLSYAYSQADHEAKLKRYEIKRDYQNVILRWFSETTKILIELRLLLTSKYDVSGVEYEYELKKANLLSMLSSQIEIGRLYFPNIDKGDGFGDKKPRAYRGYRNLTLDFLVFSYNIFLSKDVCKYEHHLVRLQREFTSIICEILNPEEFLNEVKKHSEKYFSHNLSYEEFLKRDPNNIDLFFPRRID